MYRHAGVSRKALAILALALTVPAGASVAADPAIVVAMEREFAAYAADHGWIEAFRLYSAPDGQMAGPGGIATASDLAPHLAADARVYRRQRARAEGGTASIENSRQPDPGVRYRLVRTEASSAGDLAFTLDVAHWQAGDVARAGAFARIWQYRDGRWVIVYDQLVEQPPPRPAGG